MDLNAIPQAALRAAQHAAEHHASSRTLVPDAESLRAFQAAMHPQGIQEMQGTPAILHAGEIGATSAIVPPSGVDPTVKVAPANLGESILGGLEKLGARYGESMANVRTSLAEMAAGPASFSSMMKFQVDVMQMSLQQDLTAKIVDRASQGVQTLFKNQ